MAEFVEAVRLGQVPPGTGTTATVEGKELALFNVAGTVYAIDDGCLHQGASLGTGKLEGRVVTCRAHGWKYDVTTGNTTRVPGYGVGCYQVRILDGKSSSLSAEPHRMTL
jgi:3-phenylpropionate/trans-cinnamate dioxygenase ferredoxin component